MAIHLTPAEDDELTKLSRKWRQEEVEYGEEIGAEFLHYNRSCPFLICLETKPHRHPVCPKCGSVKFGNISCDVCSELDKRRYGAMEGRKNEKG